MRVTFSEPVFQRLQDGPRGRKRKHTPLYGISRGVSIVYERAKTHRRKIFAVGAVAGAIVGIVFLVMLVRLSPESSDLICGPPQETYSDIVHFSDVTNNLVGVSLGGWLCLEDWIFSGSVGRFASTPKLPEPYHLGQGACLPPLVPGPLDAPWASEGQLASRLASGEMGTDNMNGHAFAARAFRRHRETFIQKKDFEQISALGIKSVRIPISWALFADALAQWDAETYGSHDPQVDTHIVPDPYYRDYMLATIPRRWLREVFGQMADEGLRIVLDLHNTPGGSSDGTYNAVWPEMPAFWTKSARIGEHLVPLTRVGLALSEALIHWVAEDLGDLLSRGAIWGICLLNEPAHLSFGKSVWVDDEMDIIRYIENYTNIFRASPLPENNVRLYVQIIESAFSDFDSIIPVWYNQFFSHKERHSWAVMTRHYFSAWNQTCNGAIIPAYSDASGSFSAGYQCDDVLEDVQSKLTSCIDYYAQLFIEQFDGLRAIAEWSLGTHWDANVACTNNNLLRIVFKEHIGAFAALRSNSPDDAIVEPIFWTWRVPYGPKFQPGWSLKYFSGLSIDENQNSNGHCIVGPWARERMIGYTDSRYKKAT